MHSFMHSHLGLLICLMNVRGDSCVETCNSRSCCTYMILCLTFLCGSLASMVFKRHAAWQIASRKLNLRKLASAHIGYGYLFFIILKNFWLIDHIPRVISSAWPMYKYRIRRQATSQFHKLMVHQWPAFGVERRKPYHGCVAFITHKSTFRFAYYHEIAFPVIAWHTRRAQILSRKPKVGRVIFRCWSESSKTPRLLTNLSISVILSFCS